MKLFNNRKADEEKVEEEIISMVNEGNEQGLIHDDEVEMITNIFEFSEKEVRDVMTPRSDVVGIDKHTTMDETIKIMLENNYSRYPVFDDDLDNIVGILYFKDFVKAYLKDKNQTIEQIMVEPLFVHPTKNISELFKRMQKEKIHMVIVVDEYGQTEGIIAMEDILDALSIAPVKLPATYIPNIILSTAFSSSINFLIKYVRSTSISRVITYPAIRDLTIFLI